MNTELNQILPVASEERAQIWIIGTRDRVIHMTNEFYVKRIATDRVQFTPIIPNPFATGKYGTTRAGNEKGRGATGYWTTASHSRGFTPTPCPNHFA